MKEFKIIFSLALLLMMLLPLTHLGTCLLKYATVYPQTKDKCTQLLNSAEEEYQSGKWNESIDLVEKCLAKPNLSEIEIGKAYRILSLVYIAMQSEKEANNAVKNLLIMVPNYKIQPDIDPPALQKYIDDITLTLIPEINFISPGSEEQNTDGFTMTVEGSNFVYGSKVRINGKERATTFVSDTMLLAKFSASDLLHDGEYAINVYSPILNGKISNSQKFVVKSSPISLWKWIALGSVAITIVVTAIILLKPNPEPKPIAEPPVRP